MKSEPLSLEHQSLQGLVICPASLSTYPYALITPNFRYLSKRTSVYTWQSANPSLVEGERKKKFMQTKHVNTTWSTWPEALPTVSWGAVILGSLPHLGAWDKREVRTQHQKELRLPGQRVKNKSVWFWFCLFDFLLLFVKQKIKIKRVTREVSLSLKCLQKKKTSTTIL